MDVRAHVIEVMVNAGFEAESLSDNARLKEDLDADSTELVEIAVALEKRLAISIDDTELRPIKTFGALVQFIAARCQAVVA